ncbi:flagellin, partial [Halorubrum sp. Atlit-26R]|uniref:flagellin n=1 Tax=Halorubrum sp. Atlit-26R TaxID=2282128 RepID=UPI000EF2559A
TLIVFIAMVLVAAIAAGVLINTAGFLQSQAEATGQESTDLVSDRIEVVSTTGIVNSADDGDLSEIKVVVTTAPGASDIDLNQTVIQAVGPNGTATLSLNQDTTKSASGFGIEELTGANSASEAVLNSENDEFTILLDPTGSAFGTGSGSDAFGEGDTATLDIISPASATTSVQLTSPDLYNTDSEAVRL